MPAPRGKHEARGLGTEQLVVKRKRTLQGHLVRDHGKGTERRESHHAPNMELSKARLAIENFAGNTADSEPAGSCRAHGYERSHRADNTSCPYYTEFAEKKRFQKKFARQLSALTTPDQPLPTP
eukprot:m.311552 g.311552  ORF g.311552 m.311552 type:complete len:124 (+) comp27881_c0_seq1:597-968(+)